MKRLVLGTLAAIAMAGTAAADPVLGVWKTEPDDGAYGHVEMSMCGAAICGILIRSFDDTGEIVAVLDWEIGTLGDPLADFAYALNAWIEPSDSPTAPEVSPTALPGFSSRADLTRWYEERTGADLSHLGYYRGFNSFKTACIIHGVYARYRLGMKSTEGVDMEGLFDRIISSIELAEQHLG